MLKQTLETVVGLLVTVLLVSCAGLQNNQQQGTAIGSGVGAGVGAVLGQAIGRDTEATVLGAGLGAVLGGVAGNQFGLYMDNQEEELRQVITRAEGVSFRRSQDLLIATFRGETFFDHNSAVLLPGGYREIARVATVLNRYQQTMIEVGGHTDTTGSEEYNLRLSTRRAEAVRTALINEGLQPARIRTVGYGESRPISSNHATNRRVEIVVVPARG